MRLVGTTEVTCELQSSHHLQLQSVFCEASGHVYSASARLQSPIEKINRRHHAALFDSTTVAIWRSLPRFLPMLMAILRLRPGKALDTDSLRWVGLSFFLCLLIISGPGPILLRLSIK